MLNKVAVLGRSLYFLNNSKSTTRVVFPVKGSSFDLTMFLRASLTINSIISFNSNAVSPASKGRSVTLSPVLLSMYDI